MRRQSHIPGRSPVFTPYIGGQQCAAAGAFDRKLAGAAGMRTRWQRYTSLTFLSGRLRIGLPVAAKMALSTAGATTQIVGSPTPPQKS